MKAKMKIIIPIVVAVIAVVVAVATIGLAPADRAADIPSLVSTAQQFLIEHNYEQAIAEFNTNPFYNY